MSTFFLVLHIFTCVILVFVVLIQSGKEGGIGVMGGGGSQTVFGSSGGANFFTKFTSAAAAIFMITSIVLTANRAGGRKASIFDTAPKQTASAPTIPAPAQQAVPEKKR